MFSPQCCSVTGNWIITGDFNFDFVSNDSYVGNFMDVLLSLCLHPFIFAPT